LVAVVLVSVCEVYISISCTFMCIGKFPFLTYDVYVIYYGKFAKVRIFSSTVLNRTFGTVGVCIGISVTRQIGSTDGNSLPK